MKIKKKDPKEMTQFSAREELLRCQALHSLHNPENQAPISFPPQIQE